MQTWGNYNVRYNIAHEVYVLLDRIHTEMHSILNNPTYISTAYTHKSERVNEIKSKCIEWKRCGTRTIRVPIVKKLRNLYECNMGQDSVIKLNLIQDLDKFLTQWQCMKTWQEAVILHGQVTQLRAGFRTEKHRGDILATAPDDASIVAQHTQKSTRSTPKTESTHSTACDSIDDAYEVPKSTSTHDTELIILIPPAFLIACNVIACALIATVVR